MVFALDLCPGVPQIIHPPNGEPPPEGTAPQASEHPRAEPPGAREAKPGAGPGRAKPPRHSREERRAPRPGGGRPARAKPRAEGRGARRGPKGRRSPRPRSEARREPPTPPQASGGERAQGCEKGPQRGPGRIPLLLCAPGAQRRNRAQSIRAGECPPCGGRGHPASDPPRLVKVMESVKVRKRGAVAPPYHFQFTSWSLQGFQT